ncbi:tyrosine-type recombinase/integrase [Bradyrhizobium sp. USDA 3256]
MKRKNPKYTHEFIDHDGKTRFYLRVPGRKRVPLPGLPWSPEFMAARERGLKEDWGPVQIGSGRTVAGTVNASLVSYYQSTGFKDGLAPSTRTSRKAILESFRNDHGDKRVALMHSTALQNIFNKKSPAAQRNWMKALRGWIDHCLAMKMIDEDPLKDVKLVKLKQSGGGFHAWSEEEIAQYRARHASGTKARLALEVLLQTGHARSDIVRMGRQHVKGGKLSMRRQKTGVAFDIPLLPDLVAELELQSASQLAFLTTDKGKPFTAAGFGNWFADRCIEAGVPGRAHGLRKASAIRHALNGVTAPELMAWHGWKTIGEAQRYIEEANRIRLAESAGAKIISRTGVGKPKTQFAKKQRKSLKQKQVKS